MPGEASSGIFGSGLLAEGEDVPWLTIAGALSAVASLRAEGEDVAFLNKTEQFILTMRRSALLTGAWADGRCTSAVRAWLLRLGTG
jgi:hypothetical protein